MSQPGGEPVSQPGAFPGVEPPQTPKPPLNAMGRLWPILAIGFAILSLVLLLVLVWPSGDDAMTDSAEDSAALSCRMLAEADSEGFTDMTDDESWVQINRLTVASALALTAEAHDQEFEDLRHAIDKPRIVAAQMFTMEGPEFDEALDQARAACADLGH